MTSPKEQSKVPEINHLGVKISKWLYEDFKIAGLRKINEIQEYTEWFNILSEQFDRDGNN